GDRDRIVGSERPSLARTALDEHLVGTELVPVHTHASALEVLELPRVERRPHGAELLAELRPKHGKVWLDAHLHRLDRGELDLLAAQLLSNLVGVALREAGALHDEAPKRLP